MQFRSDASAAAGSVNVEAVTARKVEFSALQLPRECTKAVDERNKVEEPGACVDNRSRSNL